MMSTMGPDTGQPELKSDPSGGRPPSCKSTTMALTFSACSWGTRALTVSASSRKSNSAMPLGDTMSGVPSSVIPMNATLAPSNVLIAYGANSG
jgi:hypothetical protein